VYSYTAGSIAVGADGMTFVWSPANGFGIASQYSDDMGSTWNVPSGLPVGLVVVADKQNAAYFYATDGNGAVYVSQDSGKTYAKTATVSGANSALAVNYAKAGDLWLGGNKLYHSTDFGNTWTTVGPSSLYYVNQLALGMPAPGSTYQGIYLRGDVNGVSGVYRSTNMGVSLLRVNDDRHQYGGNITTMTADPRVYGRYYLGTNGRGIIYGDIAH
jgi:hypothetical protein